MAEPLVEIRTLAAACRLLDDYAQELEQWRRRALRAEDRADRAERQAWLLERFYGPEIPPPIPASASPTSVLLSDACNGQGG